MSHARTIVKNTTWLISTELVTKAFAFVLIILIARYLGDAKFGIYSFVNSYVAIFLIFADFGLTLLSIREIAREKDKVHKYLSNISLLKIILSAVTLILTFGIAQFINVDQSTLILIYIASTWTIISSFGEFLRGIFRAFEKMQYEAFVRILEKSLVFVAILFIISKNYGIASIFISELIASLIILIVTLIIIRGKFSKYRFELDLPFYKKILKESWPFAASSLFVMLYFKIDTVMLKLFGKEDEVIGWYNASYNLVLALSFVPSAILSAAYPAMSRFFRDSKDKLRRVYQNSLKSLYFLGAPMIVGVTLLAAPFITLVYGEEYSGSIIALQILIWSEIFVFINTAYSTLINASNKQRIITLQTSLGVALNVTLNIFLIPKYSYIGAGIATVLTELFAFSFLAVYVNLKLLKVKFASWFTKITLCSIILGVILYFTRSYSIFITIPIGVAAYFALAYIFKIYTIKEFKRLLSLVLKRKEAITD